MPEKPTQIYQIKATLDDTHPPVWRRILVPGNTTLLKLHDILQIVMGWEDYHLHMFTIERSIYGDPAGDEYGDLGTLDESRYTLSQVIAGAGQRFNYEYDFGDSWNHTLLVEKILPPEEGVKYPVCIKGKRACPPEDVGGVWGYEGFLEAIRDPTHPEHEDYVGWIGGEFDPEAFDLEEVNARLRSMGRSRSGEAFDVWSAGEGEPGFDLAAVESDWVEKLTKEQRAVVENLPLRRDTITLLTYLRDHRVTGTKSTGNLPLKAVHEICAQFVEPPALEDAIGERVYRVRSEAEVWPLYFLHVLASVGGLVTGGLGRLWKLTSLGEQFLVAPAPIQVWHLFATWWTQTNWDIASPIEFDEDYRLADFPGLTLIHLLDLPAGDPVPFASFADRLIEAAGLVWPTENREFGRLILQGVVERVVIDPLVAFGVLIAGYSPHKSLGEEFPDLSEFQVTPFGRGLLEAMAASSNSSFSPR